MEFYTGQILTLKKKHPCGSCEWELIRLGADCRLKCCGCEHQIMLPRRSLEKSIKKK